MKQYIIKEQEIRNYYRNKFHTQLRNEIFNYKIQLLWKSLIEVIVVNPHKFSCPWQTFNCSMMYTLKLDKWDYIKTDINTLFDRPM